MNEDPPTTGGSSFITIVIQWNTSKEDEHMTLKEIRESRGMSQNDLATATGIQKRIIQAYEQGYRDINGAKLATLLAFTNALNCPIDQIVTDETTKSMIVAYNTRNG